MGQADITMADTGEDKSTSVKRMAILTVTPEALRQLLQLPNGVELVRVEMAQGQRGALRLMIEGAGWPTPEGGYVQPAQIATVHTSYHFAEDGQNIRLDKIDWNLPD